MKVKTMQAGEVESIEVYGVRRKLLGHYTEDGGPYCRLLFAGGKVYWFAVPYGKGNEAPTGEPPHTVIEAPDGNGDLLTYSDGKTYRTGGAMIPFSAADAAFLHSMKTAHAEADPATAGGVQSGTGKRGRRRQDVTQSEAAALCGVTLKTVQRWDRGEGTPEGYTGRGDAVTLRAWAARRKEAATVKRALKNTLHVDCQRLSDSDRWQASMKRRGAAGRRQGDW